MFADMTNWMCAWWECKKCKMKEFWNEEKGGAEIIALVLVIAVVMILAIMFYDKIKLFFEQLLDNIFDDGGKIKNQQDLEGTLH